MKIHLYASCCQEEPILNYFFRHYDKFVNKYFIWYDSSDDNTLSILQRYPNVQIFINKDVSMDDRKLRWVKNEAWKVEESLDCDWIICADIDEILYHPSMIELLDGYTKLGITMPRTQGYRMVNMREKLNPQDEITKIKYGIEDYLYSKYVIFNPKKVYVEYSFGAHALSNRPVGIIEIGDKIDLKLLHYVNFDINYRIKKFDLYGTRLSDFNKEHLFRTYPSRGVLEECIREDQKIAKVVI